MVDHQHDGTEGFDRLVAPLATADFRGRRWGREFVHLAGPRDKFAHLVTWDDVNRLLEADVLVPPRLRLYQAGKPVRTERYLTTRNGVPRLKAAGLVNCLGEGATLIVDFVDELLPAVRSMAEGVEEALGARTNVNLYAGWRSQHGFALHWDPQDTLILQVQGHKRWTVFPPTREHPLDGDEVAMPEGAPAWSGVLEPGDLLHLPRGWWHRAEPDDEPSLHLTVTVVAPRGADFLRWVARRLDDAPAFRANLPRPDDDAGRRDFLGFLGDELGQFLDEDHLARFWNGWEADLPLRPRLCLPDGPVEQTVPITATTAVQLAGVRRLVFDPPGPDGVVHYRAGEVRGACGPELVPALATLRGDVPRSVEELRGALEDRAAERSLLATLGALAMKGVLWTVRDGSGAGQAP